MRYKNFGLLATDSERGFRSFEGHRARVRIYFGLYSLATSLLVLWQVGIDLRGCKCVRSPGSESNLAGVGTSEKLAQKSIE